MSKGRKRKHAGPQPASRPAAAPDVELRRGLAAFRDGNCTQAIQAWQAARQPGAPKALDRALAEAHFRRTLGGATQAQRLQGIEQAVALAPEVAIYHFHLGLALHTKGALARAEAAYSQALRLDSENPRIRRHLALALLANPATAPRAADVLGTVPDNNEHITRLRYLLWLRTPSPAAEHPRGSCAGALPDRTSPLAQLDVALVLLASGEWLQAQTRLEVLNRLEKAAKAAATQRKAASQRALPGFGWATAGPVAEPLNETGRQLALLAEAAARRGRGDLNGALDLLGRPAPSSQASLLPLRAGVARELGLDFARAGRLNESIIAWRMAQGAEPACDETRGCLAHLLEVSATRAAAEQRFELAAEDWAEALALQPESSRILHNLALAEEQIEEWDEASRHWEALIRLWKKDIQGSRRQDGSAADVQTMLGVAYHHVADTLEAAGDVKASLKALERAVVAAPNDMDLRLRLAELYLDEEDYRRAIDHLRRVLAAKPNSPEVLLDLGIAYDLKGDDRQAEQLLS